MTSMARSLILGTASAIGVVWRLIPQRLRDGLFSGLLIVESRGDPKAGLRRLFAIEDRLDWVMSERAMAYEGGIHPKHRLMRYHDFFVDNAPAGSRVLDIGCGYGAVAASIAQRVPGSTVVGVDRNLPRLAQARDLHKGLSNLSFLEGDARRDLPPGKWNVIVLSNILEHIEDRVGLLRDVIGQAMPDRILIRVPCFQRDWRLPLRKELGVNYFSDPEHFIEPTVEELTAEVLRAGLRPAETRTLWGEIWMVCEAQAESA